MSLGPEENCGKEGDLQEAMDRQSKELLHMKERVATLSGRVAELEEDLDTARKDLIKSEDINSRLQRDIREVRPNLNPTELRICRVCDRPLLLFLSVSGSEGGHGGENHHAREALPGGSEGSHVGPRPQRQTGERDRQQGLSVLPGLRRLVCFHTCRE